MRLNQIKIVLFIVIGLGLSACQSSRLAGVESQPSPAESRQVLPVTHVEAQAEFNEREPGWTKAYCLSEINEIAFLPTTFERKRGAFAVFDPLYRIDRVSGAKETATCNMDFYIEPKLEEAMVELEHEYSLADAALTEFHEALTASISADLARMDFEEVRVEETDYSQPDLSMFRSRPKERLKEYVDVFYTKGEEVIFELLVVEMP